MRTSLQDRVQKVLQSEYHFWSRQLKGTEAELEESNLIYIHGRLSEIEFIAASLGINIYEIKHESV